jgi:hypothetical protein
MTLKEALSHIQRSEKLDENAALQQLRLALAEGAVCASWAMTEARLQKTGDSPTIGIQIVDDSVRDRFWLSARVNLEVGRLEFETHDVIDEDEPPYGPSRATRRVVQSDRVVWVLKESIFKIWKDEELKEAIIAPPTEHEPEEPIVEQPTKAKNSRKASQEEVIAEFRVFFKEIEVDKKPQPDVNILRGMLAHRIGKPIAEKTYWMVFNLPEFKKYQRPAGQPKKK